MRHDAIADLALRMTVGGGYGYQWTDTDELKVGTEVGLSYIYEDLETARPDNYVAARLSWNVLWVASELLSVGHSASLYPSLEDRDDVYGTADTFARANLSESMFAQLNWAFAWDNTPAAGAQRDDHLYTLTVGWSF
jgi:putative salt-induced outer membrane protein YdiY